MDRAPKSPLKLPQRQEIWYLTIRELPIWITPPDEDPFRPFGALVVNLDQGIIQGFETFPSSLPTADQVVEMLFEAMRKQPSGAHQNPHRPQQIHFEDKVLMDAMASALEEIGVSAIFQPAEEIADEILSEMAAHMMGGPAAIPGLLSQEDVEPALVEALFDAAAQYYRAAPWVQLSNMQALAIQIAPDTEPRYAVVMGNGGVEYGLALYKQWDDYLLQFELVDHPLERLPKDGAHSLFFGDITLMPFDDLDAIEEYGWEVADKEGYPIPAVFTQDSDEVKRPDRTDLLWYEAAMRAIIQFVSEHLKVDDQGDYHPARVELEISTHAGMKQLMIEYPAGELSAEARPVDMLDWAELKEDDNFAMPMNFDRRAMEGSMSTLGGGFDDHQENQAQKLMYEAWDEQNPAKRINLAHQAIAVSPNCADAYVLLAEEEADTLGRALDFYQKGVKAGEQALGKAFFAENEGYFWGILETRPYMRARAGLANILWDLKKKDEALTHYREMLCLNPGDNQGIRYSLLILLLQLNRKDEVDDLLDEYKDEWSSEWIYTQVLRIFQIEGDSLAARETLAEAREQNPHVPDYLTGLTRLPNRLPEMISPGRESEAISYTSGHLNFWRKTQGAVAWLKEQTQPSVEKPKKKARHRHKRKKK